MKDDLTYKDNNKEITKNIITDINNRKLNNSKIDENNNKKINSNIYKDINNESDDLTLQFNKES